MIIKTEINNTEINKTETDKGQSIKLDYDNRYQMIADAVKRIQKR